MVALRMSDDDAARLAVDGGEAADELHLTLMYLGEAADISPDDQQAIIDALTQMVLRQGAAPVEGNGFAVSVFNPDAGAGDDEPDPDHLPAVVLGISGDELAPFHADTLDAVSGAFPAYPTQHAPWVAHITLAYSRDYATLVGQLADRVGPVTFDALRVAFAGVVTDIPLTTASESVADDDDPESLATQLQGALAGLGVGARTREAGALAREIEKVTADV